MMHPFESWHGDHFGESPPVGYCLRVDHHERWLRLHSLPESKRYPEDELERAEVRYRARVAASQVLPAGGVVWLVVPFYEDFMEPPEALSSLVFESAGAYEHALLEGPMPVSAARTTWPHEAFDQLIDLTAFDELRPVWFSEVNGEVFAPYDGGIDLIVKDRKRAEALRRVLPSDWFSKRADML